MPAGYRHSFLINRVIGGSHPRQFTSLDFSSLKKYIASCLAAAGSLFASRPESSGFVLMDVTTHDVLLVGGGGAGLRAAIAVSEFNPNLSVAVVSKVYPMRSHTVSAEGEAAAVIQPGDTLDQHAYDTLSAGHWLCHQDAVEAVATE